VDLVQGCILESSTAVESGYSCKNIRTLVEDLTQDPKVAQDKMHVKLTGSIIPDEIVLFIYTTELEVLGGALKMLPECLGHLKVLRKLLLNGNKFTEVPAVLLKLTKLESLEMQNNLLTEVPEWLSDLDGLESLNLSGNKITTLPASFAELQSMTVLDLSKNNLKAIPSCLLETCNLQMLNVADNQIPELTPWPQDKNLSLSELCLKGNPIDWKTSIQKAQGKPLLPEHLATLDIGDNLLLTELPPELTKLRGLANLMLCNTGITQLPNLGEAWPELELLDLSNTSIRDLTPLADLQQCGELDLNHLNLDALPPEIFGINGLKLIELNHAIFPEFPTALPANSEVVHVELQHCGLKTVPQAIFDLPDLEHLSLSHNQLSILPPRINNA